MGPGIGVLEPGKPAFAAALRVEVQTAKQEAWNMPAPVQNTMAGIQNYHQLPAEPQAALIGPAAILYPADPELLQGQPIPGQSDRKPSPGLCVLLSLIHI